MIVCGAILPLGYVYSGVSEGNHWYSQTSPNVIVVPREKSYLAEIQAMQGYTRQRQLPSAKLKEPLPIAAAKANRQ